MRTRTRTLARCAAAVSVMALVAAVAVPERVGGPSSAPAAASGAGAPVTFPALVPGVRLTIDADVREQLVDAADDALRIDADPRDPLRITRTTDPFVRDARAAWTLALAARVTGQDRYARAAGELVDAWAGVRDTEDTCADSGGCSTSLMISRAAPGFVFAAGLLRSQGDFAGPRLERFRRWLRTVVLPAASDRANNWGDAGTFLRAAVALELGDRSELAEAVELWKWRIDLMEPDGRIPEEIRRGRSSLMYSQEALGYRVMTAELFSMGGVDVWDHRGRGGGSLRRGLDLVARGLADPHTWPVRQKRLRVPTPAPMWSLVAHHWSSGSFERLADEARREDGGGHSAVMWLAVTHGS